jgi:hypothetical protein
MVVTAMDLRSFISRNNFPGLSRLLRIIGDDRFESVSRLSAESVSALDQEGMSFRIDAGFFSQWSDPDIDVRSSAQSALKKRTVPSSIDMAEWCGRGFRGNGSRAQSRPKGDWSLNDQ